MRPGEHDAHLIQFPGSQAAPGPAEDTPPPGQRLTCRELEVLELVAAGLPSRQIGGQLFISEETVNWHIARILSKLHARSRAHAVATAIRQQIIPPD